MNHKVPTARWAGWIRLPAMLLFCWAVALSFQQGEYDLLLKGGYVIDPKNGISGRRDVAISDGTIAAVSESIDASKADRTLDVADLIITPGLIDLHVHMFSTTNIPGAWAGDNSVQPDSNTLPTGITTAVDAGSSGWRNFEFFPHEFILGCSHILGGQSFSDQKGFNAILHRQHCAADCHAVFNRPPQKVTPFLRRDKYRARATLFGIT